MRGGDLKGRSRKGMDLAAPEPPFSLPLEWMGPLAKSPELVVISGLWSEYDAILVVAMLASVHALVRPSG